MKEPFPLALAIYAALMTVLLTVCLCLAWSERKPMNNDLPLVHAATLQAPKPLWLAPCGVAPSNLPKWKDRRA